MERVLIVGSGGAGKSTFARLMGGITGLPVVHLDAHHWRSGWVEPSRDEWLATMRRLISGERWIIDGNYSGVEFQVRLERADTIVLMDLPRRVCLWRALKRPLSRTPRLDMPEGCPERFYDLEYLKFLRWIWRYSDNSLPRILDAIATHGDGITLHRLTSQREADEFLAGLQSTRRVA